MARRCICSRLVAAVEGDPRLRTLPLAARMLFLLVAEAAARSPVPGLLPFREPRRVSLLVSAPETETETQLETLRREGLIRDEGEGIGVPLLLDAPPKAEVARRNGAAGGRPRKGETAEAARERRQREMLLPMPAAPAAKPSETQAAKPVSVTTTTSQVSSQSEAQEGKGSAREAPEWAVLGAEVAELARLDGARGGFDYRPVQAWLAEGVTPDQVRAAVLRAASRPTYSADRVRSLGYFAKAVADERGRPAPSPAIVVRDTAEDAARVAAAQRRIEAALRGYSVAAA